MAKYRVIIWSNDSRGREYGTDSRSAMKAAQEFGRCEDGEIVSVCGKRYGLIDRVAYLNGQYIRVAFDPMDLVREISPITGDLYGRF